MLVKALAESIAIGLAVSAPVGPIGMLCIQRTLFSGRTAGLVAGLGAATADALYALLAALSLSLVSGFLSSHHFLIELAGGACMIGLGIRIFRSPAAAGTAPPGPGGLAGNYFSTLALTLTNPMTIAAFAAIFAGLGLGRQGSDHLMAVTMVWGVFTGACLWWISLTWLVSRLQERVIRRMGEINHAAGIVIALFGAAAVFTALS